jgi:hypothetical protein
LQEEARGPALIKLCPELEQNQRVVCQRKKPGLLNTWPSITQARFGYGFKGPSAKFLRFCPDLEELHRSLAAGFRNSDFGVVRVFVGPPL